MLNYSKKIKDLYNKTVNMTRNTKNTKKSEVKKYLILEGKGADFKDRTMRYEKFKVIIGSDKEELNFYYTFFTSNSLIKKGETYQLSTTGNFVEDSSGIIQGIDNGGYEFERVVPSLLIKELWEEKEKNKVKSILLEEDLKNKIKDVERINNELFGTKNELTSLKSRFDKLQTESGKNAKDLGDTRETLRKKEDEIKRINRDLADSKEERSRLQKQVNSLQSEKNKIENE
jgi:hypothetical protein